MSLSASRIYAPVLILSLLLTCLPHRTLALTAPAAIDQNGVAFAANQMAATEQISASDNRNQEETDAAEAPVGASTAVDRRTSLFSGWLHMLDKKERAGLEDSIISFGPRVPQDLARVLRLSGNGRWSGFLGVLAWALISIAIGYLVVYGLRRFTRDSINQLEQITPPNKDRLACLWAGILRIVPALASLILVALVATLVFLLFATAIQTEGRMLFQLLLGAALSAQLCSIVGTIVFAPTAPEVRPFEIPDTLALPLHRAFVKASTIMLVGLLFVHYIRGLGAASQTIIWIIIILGTMVIAAFGYLVLYLRKPVRTALLSELADGSWFLQQVGGYWHVPALLYLLVVWFIWVGRELTGTFARNGSFIVSLVIVPTYLILSYVGGLVIEAVVDSLGLGAQKKDSLMTESDIELDELEVAARKRTIVRKAALVFRLVLLGALTTWLLSLWGFKIPYAANAVRAIFESLITLALALICWRFASTFIQKKIDEALPEPEDKEVDMDDEFGGAVPRGRSHTLLPMLRKVIGSILVVMVVLIVLSSLGVNIGPLLAGAGVVGLAVGFGAQKLVSDVLSGFFFLLDDAFRVGEYIQAGKTRGTVEAITLRNVMLRHHLGMLQVVPHSDLGAITNYMRGGIVIKFPLEFPYDTNIDQVRKIIKQVGQAMLEDEEIGDGFIQPLKSQGVYEIANSIMVIRVKFTAKPGKQFLIKREAFRRITEALSRKGIYYACHKVIVDFPEDLQKSFKDSEAREKALRAGAAAALQIEAEKQEKLQKQAEESQDK